MNDIWNYGHGHTVWTPHGNGHPGGKRLAAWRRSQVSIAEVDCLVPAARESAFIFRISALQQLRLFAWLSASRQRALSRNVRSKRRRLRSNRRDMIACDRQAFLPTPQSRRHRTLTTVSKVSIFGITLSKRN